MNKRGSIPLFVASTLPIALVAGVFAIDAGRVWLAQARLQTALDAAALTAARDLSLGEATAKANAEAVLKANFNGGAPNQADTTWGNIKVSASGDSVTVSASVSVNPLLNRIAGISDGKLGVGSIGRNSPVLNPRVVNRAASAVRSTTGMELALVFDITLSMTSSDVGNGKTRIRSAADAGLTLLRVLYDDKVIPPGATNTNKKWSENLFVSVVPFATAVNVGRDNTGFLGAARTTGGYDNYNLTAWDKTKPGWGGCVEMRALASRDANPKTAGLTRFYARSTYDTSKTTTAGHCPPEAAYKDTRNNNPSGANNVCMGHNDWTAPNAVFSGEYTGKNNKTVLVDPKQNTLVADMVNWSSHKIATIDPWAEAWGPNMMCPPETHRVLPLTRDRATIESLINRIGTVTDLPFSAGTNIAPGLMVGWFTLSPSWRAGTNGFTGWPSAEPATTPDTRPAMPALPFDYFLPQRRKVLILLTDGDNTWFNADSFQDKPRLVRPESTTTQEGFYGAYGNLRDHFGTTNDTIAKGVARVNEESVKWCKAIRGWQNPSATTAPSGPEPITVFTISFSGSVSQPARTLLEGCASKRDDGSAYYWHAPDDNTLQQIFQAIGAELTKLRLTT